MVCPHKSTSGFPAKLVGFIESMALPPWLLLLIINFVLLIVGTVLEPPAAILVLTPLLLPIVLQAGVDPIHFGVIIVVNLMIHGLTPPLGMLIFVVSGVTQIPASELFRAVVPYLLALLVSLAILCAWAIIF